MPEPILAVDFGTSTSSAVLVADGRDRPVRDPLTSGFLWPSAVFRDGDRLLVGSAAERRKQSAPERYRTGFKRVFAAGHTIDLGGHPYEVVDLVAELLGQLRAAVEPPSGRPVNRAVLTIPSSYGTNDPRRALMVEAGRRAGFTDVDLLFEPVAAALSPIVDGALPEGSTVLVYDLGGGTFDAALVRFADGGHQVLGHAAEEHTGGRDIDALLVKHAVAHAGKELAAELDPAMTGSGTEVDALRGRLLAEDMLRNLKHVLSSDETGVGYLTARLPPVELTRPQLAKLVDQLVATTVACCRRLLAEAGVDPADLTAVLAVGGSSRLHAVTLALPGLCGTVRKPEDVDLAVVQGAAAWAGRADGRRLRPVPVEKDERPLRWSLPVGDAAELTRWTVRPGEVYGPGTPLGVVRLDDGSLWQLRDIRATAGLLRHVQASPGTRVFSGDWLATVTAPAPEHVVKPAEQVTGARFAGPDMLWLTAKGAPARWSPPATQVRREPVDATAGLVRTCPDERRALYFKTVGGELVVWDADGADELIRVPVAGPPTEVAAAPGTSRVCGVVGSREVRVWRVGSQEEPLVIAQPAVVFAVFSPVGEVLATVGNSAAITLWDSRTGQDVRQLTHTGLQWLRFPSYSADGTRLAVAGSDNSVRVWDPASGVELLSCPHPQVVRGTAFSPDGQRLLTLCDDAHARIWDVRTGAEVVRLPHRRALVAGAFDDDGRRVVTVANDGEVQVWRPTSGS